MTAPRPRILCVDDEQHVLDGLSRVLRRSYDVEVARGGIQAMQRLQQRPHFVVVMSDMRMPGFNGTKVLKAAREHMPDATRVLLTGQADVQDAIGAVNDGQIFRYLTKPCHPADLEAALLQAVEQHELRIAQRQLLEETLTGSVRGLIELLAMANPIAFGRATRAREMVVALARLIGFKDVWCIEMAAMLSQIGMLTLPPDLAVRLAEGQPLSAEEEAQVARIPQEALRVLQGIPRLDEVRAILSGLRLDFAGPVSQELQGELIPLGARILRPILDLDRLTSAGRPPAGAVRELETRARLYDPAVVSDLKVILSKVTENEAFVEMQLTDVQIGMTFVRDVRMPDGTLLIARRQPVTEALLDRIHSYWAHIDSINPVRVAPAAD